MSFAGRGILLDIEGTTSSVSYVYDVMFPQVRRELSGFLQSRWQDVDVRLACDQIARDAGQVDLITWSGPDEVDQRQVIQAEVIKLMDGDVKATGLKQLQGLIWRDAFESGQMKAHVYPDVPDGLRRWRNDSLDIRIYSSGSVQAQRLFFGHTELGDLLSFFSGHYDTTIGSKKEELSYSKIASDWGIAAEEILFISDVLDELDAAELAGFQTRLCVRPNNASVARGHDHKVIETFDQV